MMKNAISIFLVILTLSSCSIAPFSSTTSGRSIGAGNFQFEVGNINNNFNLRIGTGLSPDFDMGFVMEFGSLATTALYTKYSFINNKIGPSLAMELGYGSSESSTFYYAGMIASLTFSRNFELFIAPRINSVSTDSADIELNQDYGNFRLKEYDATYLQLAYGFNLYFSNNAGIALYSTYYKGDEIETLSDSTFGANFLFRF